MSIDERKLLEFKMKLEDFVYDMNLLSNEFNERASVLETIIDEIKYLTDLPKINKEEINTLINTFIILSKLSIDKLINELNKKKKELETIEKKWGEIYGDNTN